MFPNLEAEMVRNKITRQFLAEKTGRTYATMCMKLNGKAQLTLSECIEIKKIVNPACTLDYLFDSTA